METKTAIFAGGCFWCIDAEFRKMPKLIDIESGYTGGVEKYANYSDHKYHGHREAVKVTYDPQQTTFKDLVRYFFTKHDPTDAGGSFYDRGYSYSPAVYYENESEKSDILEVIKELEEKLIFDKPIVTAVEERQPFYPAEEYHQNYAAKNPEHYKQYANASGRKDYIKNIEDKL